MYTAGFDLGVRPSEDDPPASPPRGSPTGEAAHVRVTADITGFIIRIHASHSAHFRSMPGAGHHGSMSFPEPLTPVMQTKRPSGMATSKSCRLLQVNLAKRIRAVFFVTVRLGGDSMFFLP